MNLDQNQLLRVIKSQIVSNEAHGNSLADLINEISKLRPYIPQVGDSTYNSVLSKAKQVQTSYSQDILRSLLRQYGKAVESNDVFSLIKKFLQKFVA